jgi:hypothetical protein
VSYKIVAYILVCAWMSWSLCNLKTNVSCLSASLLYGRKKSEGIAVVRLVCLLLADAMVCMERKKEKWLIQCRNSCFAFGLYISGCGGLYVIHSPDLTR